jgi:hypothetical protein
MENIKAFSILPIEERKIIKRIDIIKGQYSNRILGTFFYERNLSDTYKFKEIPEENRDFNYYVEYPKQDNFPNDILDGIIFQTIKNHYPYSRLSSFSKTSSIDQLRFGNLSSFNVISLRLNIIPNLSHENIDELKEDMLNGLKKSILVHGVASGVSFYECFGYYNLKDKEIIDKIDKITFL